MCVCLCVPSPLTKKKGVAQPTRIRKGPWLRGYEFGLLYEFDILDVIYEDCSEWQSFKAFYGKRTCVDVYKDCR